MAEPSRPQMSETFLLGAVLSLAGGFLDAYTYLVRGGVFANAQTGNVVLLGINLMDRDWARAGHYLVPILAFAAGVLTARLVHDHLDQRGRLHWRQLTVGAEVLLLLAVAALPATASGAANVLVSYVCAIQAESFRKFNGNVFASTMCTGNLRSGTEQLYQYWRAGGGEHGRRAAQYYGIVLFFAAGAALGAWCSRLWGRPAALGAGALLILAFFLMFQRKTLAGQQKGV